MYILAFLLFLILAAFFIVVMMPAYFLNVLTRWFFSRSGVGNGKSPFDDESRRMRESEQSRQDERAPRGEDGKIFSADEGEYVDFEEIKS